MNMAAYISESDLAAAAQPKTEPVLPDGARFTNPGDKLSSIAANDALGARQLGSSKSNVFVLTPKVKIPTPGASAHPLAFQMASGAGLHGNVGRSTVGMTPDQEKAAIADWLASLSNDQDEGDKAALMLMDGSGDVNDRAWGAPLTRNGFAHRHLHRHMVHKKGEHEKKLGEEGHKKTEHHGAEGHEPHRNMAGKVGARVAADAVEVAADRGLIRMGARMLGRVGGRITGIGLGEGLLAGAVAVGLVPFGFAATALAIPIAVGMYFVSGAVINKLEAVADGKSLSWGGAFGHVFDETKNGIAKASKDFWGELKQGHVGSALWGATKNVAMGLDYVLTGGYLFTGLPLAYEGWQKGRETGGIAGGVVGAAKEAGNWYLFGIPGLVGLAWDNRKTISALVSEQGQAMAKAIMGNETAKKMAAGTAAVALKAVHEGGAGLVSAYDEGKSAAIDGVQKAMQEDPRHFVKAVTQGGDNSVYSKVNEFKQRLTVPGEGSGSAFGAVAGAFSKALRHTKESLVKLQADLVNNDGPKRSYHSLKSDLVDTYAPA